MRYGMKRRNRRLDQGEKVQREWLVGGLMFEAKASKIRTYDVLG
jgi:hypothetical protein